MANNHNDSTRYSIYPVAQRYYEILNDQDKEVWKRQRDAQDYFAAACMMMTEVLHEATHEEFEEEGKVPQGKFLETYCRLHFEHNEEDFAI